MSEVAEKTERRVGAIVAATVEVLKNHYRASRL